MLCDLPMNVRVSAPCLVLSKHLINVHYSDHDKSGDDNSGRPSLVRRGTECRMDFLVSSIMDS